MNAWHRPLAVALALLLAVVGCTRKESTLETLKPGPSLTTDDVRQFGEKLEASANARDDREINLLYDKDAMLQLILSGLPVMDAQRKGLRDGLNISKMVTSPVAEGGSF